jgi:ABC-2 type transport system permease protein
MFWRNPGAAAFTFAFPLLFLVVFTAVYGNSTVRVRGGTVRFAQYYVPSIVCFGIISACYTNLAFLVCIRRQNGVLKRVRGTPLSPADYLAGVMGNVMAVTLIVSALTIVMGVTMYGVSFPGRYASLLVTAAVGAFCFSSLGVAVSTFVPNEDAAPAIINFLIFPLLFISGMFGPVADSSALAKVASLFPVRPMIKQMVAVFDPFTSGPALSTAHLGVMLLWGLAGVVLAVRRFRWEPSSS